MSDQGEMRRVDVKISLRHPGTETLEQDADVTPGMTARLFFVECLGGFLCKIEDVNERELTVILLEPAPAHPSGDTVTLDRTIFKVERVSDPVADLPWADNRLRQQEILDAGGYVCRSCGFICTGWTNDGRDLCTTCQRYYDTLAMREWVLYELPDQIRSAEVALTIGNRRDDRGPAVNDRALYLDDLRIRIGDKVFNIQTLLNDCTCDATVELYAEVA